MKAIQEIIDYLLAEGCLASDDLRKLDAQGLLEGTHAARLVENDGDDAARHPHERGDELSDDERRLEQTEAALDRLPRPRRTGGVRPVSRIVARNVVSDRLLDCFAENSKSLDGFRTLAAMIDEASDFGSAVRVLANAGEAELEEAIRAAFANAALVDAVWEAVYFDGYRSIVQQGEHGPAVVACRALIEGAGPAELGRYMSELAAPGLGSLRLLMRVQNRVGECIRKTHRKS